MSDAGPVSNSSSSADRSVRRYAISVNRSSLVGFVCSDGGLVYTWGEIGLLRIYLTLNWVVFVNFKLGFIRFSMD